MSGNDLLGDRQAKPRATAVGRARGIQPVELLEDHAELGSGNWVALVFEAHDHAVGRLLGKDPNGRPLVAVRNRVLHHVVEHARHLVAIDEHDETRGCLHLN